MAKQVIMNVRGITVHNDTLLQDTLGMCGLKQFGEINPFVTDDTVWRTGPFDPTEEGCAERFGEMVAELTSLGFILTISEGK